MKKQTFVHKNIINSSYIYDLKFYITELTQNNKCMAFQRCYFNNLNLKGKIMERNLMEFDIFQLSSGNTKQYEVKSSVRNSKQL